jgi:hypothetical protein
VHSGPEPESVEKLGQFLYENPCRIGRLHGNLHRDVFRQSYATDLGVPVLLATSFALVGRWQDLAATAQRHYLRELRSCIAWK